MAERKNCEQKKEAVVWTCSEVELLLESVKAYASECLFGGKDWEGVKSKYEKIKDTFVERYPKVKDGEEVDEDYP